ELGFVEFAPKQDGRNMIMVLGPHKKKTEAMAEARAAKEQRKAGGPAAEEAPAPAAEPVEAEQIESAASAEPIAPQDTEAAAEE
ncbi:MAG: translation initiation factor IF-3, partial [Catenulispora sp.]|nr:translation initiation factor IF-3 [Catenulispora sp.]